jgi:uncharacterized membrane protein
MTSMPLVRPGTGGRILSGRRALACLGLGALAAAVTVVVGDPSLAPLLGWCTGALLILVWVWRISWPQDHEGTRRLAREERVSRTTDDLVVGGSLASIVAVVLALIESSQEPGSAVSAALAILAVLAAMLSWALVNTVYALKYARLYYLDEHGGIDFHQENPPAYSDFAYLAFTVGMSFAVSDTEPTSTAVRRKALPHALLSYFFGTVILAVAINLVTNLAQS